GAASSHLPYRGDNKRPEAAPPFTRTQHPRPPWTLRGLREHQSTRAQDTTFRQSREHPLSTTTKWPIVEPARFAIRNAKTQAVVDCREIGRQRPTGKRWPLFLTLVPTGWRVDAFGCVIR